MAVNLGLSALSKIYLGETEIQKVYLGDTQVYTNVIPVTATPTISNVSTAEDTKNAGKREVTFTVTNNDTVGGTLYYDIDNASPTRTTAIAGSEAKVLTINNLEPSTAYTLYAQVLSTGKTISLVDSEAFFSGGI